ncbi:MAG: hypothetical protein ACUVXI_19830 [bacterium]
MVIQKSIEDSKGDRDQEVRSEIIRWIKKHYIPDLDDDRDFDRILEELEDRLERMKQRFLSRKSKPYEFEMGREIA